ncbi:hypothetical protein [Salimicrobium album]|uniref:Uncharacterized protein n=1 Tax=Salimicrobium album TaxID=50717 RepID=A0A1H3FTX9_9BACI|nr:hypothetical protein [Salimicrobium album]SDX94390.1 hypothetical protein SAMN04488081_1679 [Salimicrobium album]
MADREMIEEIVREVLNSMNVPARPDLYVIQRSEPARELLERLGKDWVVKWVNPLHSDYPDDAGAVYFPAMDQDFLVKSSLGIADTAETWWFARLMKNKTTVYVTLEGETAGLLNDTSPYATMVSEYVSKLETFSVKVTDKGSEVLPEKQEEPSPNVYPDKLLTATEIDKWRHKEIYVRKGTIITPLAKDAARDREIQILYT